MAFKVHNLPKIDNVTVVSKHDDAVNHDETDWHDYVKDYDYKKLHFLPGKEPTKFICNFSHNADEAATLKNSMMGGYDDVTKKPKVTIGSYQQMVVRFSLKSIVNPSSLPKNEHLDLKKDGKYVHIDSLTKFERWGLVDEIFQAYSTMTKANPTEGNEKN